jgi:AcrR family transcriptional regulator
MRTALRLVDQHGVEGLTMRKLATAVGVTPMAIYRYVANKRALRDELIDTVLDQFVLPKPKRGTWIDGVKIFAHTARRLFQTHPGIVPLLASSPALSRGALRVYEAALRILRESGLDDEGIAEAYGTLFSYTFGFVALELGRARPWAKLPRASLSDRANWESYARTLPRKEFRVLIELAPYVSRFDDAQFECGLDMMITGIQARLRGRRSRAVIASGRSQRREPKRRPTHERPKKGLLRADDSQFRSYLF